jgi:hypothetical protein
LSFLAFGGFGVGYSMDFNLKFAHYLSGSDYLGVDMQYLFKETRKSYFNIIGGLHYQNDFGLDS